MRRRRVLIVAAAVGVLGVTAVALIVRARETGSPPAQPMAVAANAKSASSLASAQGEGQGPAQGPGKDQAASGSVALPKEAAARNAIALVRVRETRLAGDIQLTGNVSYDADHFAMVGPLVADAFPS